MNIHTLFRFLVTFIAAVCMSSAMAQEPSKTTTKTTGKVSAATTAKAPTAPAFDSGATPDNVFYKTDQFWDHGVARMWAGFYVRFTPENIKQYVYGNTVVFGNGEKRKIIGSTVNGDSAWDVRVEGDKLDSAKVGSPSKFKVTLARPPAPAATAAPAAAATKKAAPTMVPKKTPSK